MNRNFDDAIREARLGLKGAKIVHSNYWQGVDISKMPAAATHELLNWTLTAPMTWDLPALAKDTGADLPWADDHFAERISGRPMNPSPSEDWWPYAPKDQKNSKFMKDYGDGVPRFSHTYPERMWPQGLRGQRFPYGDAISVAKLLADDPWTRQAFLPIWWPEDGGAASTERKPCTLGYQFIMRDGQLHCVYFIRSCDFVKHFRNDIYMAVRLASWMRDRALFACATHGTDEASYLWEGVGPGTLTMHITSLHVFRNDYIKMFGHG